MYRYQLWVKLAGVWKMYDFFHDYSEASSYLNGKFAECGYDEYYIVRVEVIL